MAVRRRILVLFTGIFLFLVGNAVLTTHYFLRFIGNNQWVLHTQQALLSIETIDSYLNRSGALRMGYISTGDESRAKDMEGLLERFRAHLENLRELTSDNPDQADLIRKLEPLLRGRSDLLARSVEAYRRNPGNRARQEDTTLAISRYSLPIQDILAEMRRVEGQLLEKRAGESEATIRETIFSFEITLALALFFLVLALLYMDRNIRQKALMDSIQSSMADGVMVFGKDLEVLFHNPAAEKVLDPFMSPFLGAKWNKRLKVFREDGVTPLPVEQWPAARAVQGERIDEAVYYLQGAGMGEGAYFRVTGRPLRDARGAVFGGLIVFRDITANLKAGERLERLAAIVESSSDAIIGKTVEGDIVSWNKGAEAMFGYRAEEAIGRHVSMLEKDGARHGFAELTARLAEVGSIPSLETVRRTKDGRSIDVSLTFSAIRDARGRVTGISSIARDISESKQAEERFLQVFEASPSGMVLTDEKGAITLVNQELERLFGWSRDELIGKPVEVLVPEKLRDRHPSYRAGFIARPETRPMGSGRDLYGLRKDGSEFPVEIGLKPIRMSRGVSILGVVVDITRRKKDEGTVREYTRRLEESNQNLKDFVYVASHDLKEPLRKMQAFGDLLKRELGEGLTPAAGQYLDYIRDGARRMGLLLEDLLELTRVTTQGKPFQILDLKEVLMEVVGDLDILIRETGGKVVLGELPRLEGDPVQVRQLFQNLIINSLKYHKTDAPPLVRVEAVQDPPPGFYVIQVTDNGIGFHQKYADKIFNVFQRLHTAEEFEGTGIGLAICRKVAERHGGSIRARSELGEGAVFEVVWPLHPSARGTGQKA